MPKILSILFACCCLLALSGCTDTWIGEDMDTAPVDYFDQIWSEIDLRYSHFGLKGVDWDSLRETLRPAALSAKNDRELFDVICEMMHSLKDGHVNLLAPIDTCSYNDWYAPYPRNYYPERIQANYLLRPLITLADSRIEYQIIDRDIGYIHLASFSGSGWADEIDTALRGMSGVRALVFDVRDNGGGSSGSAEEIAGRFAAVPYAYGSYRFRNGPEHDDFGDSHALTVEPTGDMRFAGPLALLTNRRCYSACESFTLAMLELPQLVSFGDTTGGGLGNPIFRELPNGWLYRFPVWLEATVDGQLLEGKGIAPDRYVTFSAEDYHSGRDTILDAALAHLRAQISNE